MSVGVLENSKDVSSELSDVAGWTEESDGKAKVVMMAVVELLGGTVDKVVRMFECFAKLLGLYVVWHDARE